MKKDINHALELYRQNRFERISERNINVDSHNVFLQTKRGRSILLCDCQNSTEFADTNICRHKLLFLLLPYLEKLNKRLKQLELFYTLTSLEDTKILTETMVKDLKEIERIKT